MVAQEYALLEKYNVIEKLGWYSYGRFYLAEKKSECKTRVAIKKVTRDEVSQACIVFESSLLSKLKHPNIVDLREVVIDHNSGVHWFVFEYVGKSLRDVLELQQHKQGLPLRLIQRLAWSLLEGLRACHAVNVIHQDLKPGHILVTDNDESKICDFSLRNCCQTAQQVSDDSHILVTDNDESKICDFSVRNCCQTAQKVSDDLFIMHYRPPELLLGAKAYGPEIDIWSVGCIVAEMARGKAPFRSKSDIGTLFEIFKLLGTPDNTTWPGCEDLEFYSQRFPGWTSTQFHDFVLARPDLDDTFFRSLGQLLAYPTTRITAEEANQSSFIGEAMPVQRQGH